MDKMTLRKRGYLVEATYKRDKKVREIANSFYNALIKFLKRNSNTLERRRDGGLSIHSMNFWRHPKAENFGVIFRPANESQSTFKNAKQLAAIGKSGRQDVIVLWNLLGPHDSTYIETRTTGMKGAIIHEMAHYLDPAYNIKTDELTKLFNAYIDAKPGKDAGRIENSLMALGVSSDVIFDIVLTGKLPDGIKRIKTKTKTGIASYYNSPEEWNAYWHEGADKFEDFLKHRSAGTRVDLRVKKMLMGDGTFKGFYSKLKNFWDNGFLQFARKKTRRKFDKRLYQLWKAMEEQDLI